MRPRFLYISLTQKSAKWLADRLRKRQGPLSFPRLQTDVDTQGKKHHVHPDLARNNLTKIHTGSICFPVFHNFMHFRHLSTWFNYPGTCTRRNLNKKNTVRKLFNSSYPEGMSCEEVLNIFTHSVEQTWLQNMSKTNTTQHVEK